MFKIEAAVRTGYTTVACTEQPCQWNKCFVKKVQPATIAETQFYKEEAKQKYINQPKARVIQGATEQEQAMFLEKLSKCSKRPVGLSSFSGFSNLFQSEEKSSKISFFAHRNAFFFQS